jgi:hypothetical protein
MQLTLSDQLKQFMRVMQGSLFPALEEQLGARSHAAQAVGIGSREKDR